jgi:hypothetical protein
LFPQSVRGDWVAGIGKAIERQQTTEVVSC